MDRAGWASAATPPRRIAILRTGPCARARAAPPLPSPPLAPTPPHPSSARGARGREDGYAKEKKTAAPQGAKTKWITTIVNAPLSVQPPGTAPPIQLTGESKHETASDGTQLVAYTTAALAEDVSACTKCLGPITGKEGAPLAPRRAVAPPPPRPCRRPAAQ